MKKLLSVILAIIMVASVLPLAFATETETENDAEFTCDYEIGYGETITIQAPLLDDGTFTYVKFVPEQDGKYIFQSIAEDIDTFCYLYDSTGCYLDENDDTYDYNFEIKYDFVAGETYYFAVAIYSDDNGNEFDVSLSCGHSYENGVCTNCGAVCYHECTDFDAGFCDCGEVYYGKDIEVGFDEKITAENGLVGYFRFVPEESGTYIFASSSDTDPVCHVYDSELIEVDSSDDVIGYDFILATYLEEGTPYYFEVMLLGDEGNVNLRLEKAVHTAADGSEHEIYLDEGYSSGCTEHGFSAGFYCEECDEYIWGHDELPFEHYDWDEDGICDDCGAEIYTFWEKIVFWFENLIMNIQAFFAMVFLMFIPV